MKTSIELPDDLMKKLKEYNHVHKDRPINVSGVAQVAIERILGGEKSLQRVTTSELSMSQDEAPASQIGVCPKCGQNNILMIGGSGRKCSSCGIKIKWYESSTERGVKVLESGKCPKCGQLNAFMVNGPSINCLLCDAVIMFYENETDRGVKEVAGNGTEV